MDVLLVKSNSYYVKKCLKIIQHLYYIMTEYKFGPGKNFTGTDDEWNKLRQTVIKDKHKKQYKTNNVYPFVTVICPHCGSINTHICDGTFSHRECHLISYGGCDFSLMKCLQKDYDCPGYYMYTPK